MYRRLIAAGLLVAYSAFLVKWMVLKDVPLVRIGPLQLNFGGTAEGKPNLVPFATIVPYLLGRNGLIISGINLVGNVVLLVPLGFVVALLFRRISWRRSLAIGVAACLAIESLQMAFEVGIFDIDDVILNVLGFMIGHGAAVLFLRQLPAMSRRRSLLAAAFGLAIVAAVGVFGYQKFPIRFEPAVEHSSSGTDRHGDLCGGTGGNGEIVTVAAHSFVMRRADGSTQTVTLNRRAEVKTPTGPGSIADLTVGDRATLVGDVLPDGNFAAHAVFVCSPPRER